MHGVAGEWTIMNTNLVWNPGDRGLPAFGRRGDLLRAGADGTDVHANNGSIMLSPDSRVSNIGRLSESQS
jgi:hypothetical protein